MAFLKDITLGRYFPAHSFLHRLDPRSKLAVSILLMTTLLISNNLGSMLMFLLLCGVAVIYSRIPATYVLRNLKPFMWLFLITFLIHALTTPGEAIVSAMGIRLTAAGLINGALYSARLGLLIVLATLLTMTTTPIDLTDGLERLMRPFKKLKVPVHEIAFMMSLSLRFVPILIREAERIKNAQISRGLSLDGSLLQRVRNIIPMMMPLFVSAIRRADDLAVAMEARCYSGGRGRTSFGYLAFGQRDYLLMAGNVVFCAGVLFIGA